MQETARYRNKIINVSSTLTSAGEHDFPSGISLCFSSKLVMSFVVPQLPRQNTIQCFTMTKAYHLFKDTSVLQWFNLIKQASVKYNHMLFYDKMQHIVPDIPDNRMICIHSSISQRAETPWFWMIFNHICHPVSSMTRTFSDHAASSSDVLQPEMTFWWSYKWTRDKRQERIVSFSDIYPTSHNVCE